MSDPRGDAGQAKLLWNHATEDTVEVALDAGRLGYQLKIDHVTVWVSRDGSQVRGEGRPLDDSLRRRIRPLVEQLRGRVTLHASAVEWRPGVVVAFVGSHGTGKSTIAGALARSLPVVADDCLEVLPIATNVFVRGDGSSIRLVSREDGGVPEKVVTDGGAPSSDFGVLRAAWVIEQPTRSRATLRRVTPVSGMGMLARHTFRLDPLRRDLLRAEFDRLAWLVREVPVFRFGYPHCRGALERVSRLVDQVVACRSTSASPR